MSEHFSAGEIIIGTPNPKIPPEVLYIFKIRLGRPLQLKKCPNRKNSRIQSKKVHKKLQSSEIILSALLL